MALVVFYTRRVREALQRPAALGPELLFLFVVGGAVGLLVLLSRRVAAPYTEQVFIDLHFRALPKYTMLSLSRGFAAYFISLIFTLIYGTIAAHNQRAEKLMLPALDVLQAIPVLGFLPGLVLAMVHLFPTREMGLEIACVIMIFTAQAWNMTFSFHGSLRAIPSTLREVAAIQHFSDWQVFRKLEVPAAMIGLVWNSMMSMAGGWFFLTVNEAFTLRDHDYRLPGIGSYMNEAILKNNKSAMVAAVIAMTTMIVVVDQLFWRPIVVWAQRFRMDELAQADPPQSWVLNILQKSRLYSGLHYLALMLRRKGASRKMKTGDARTSAPPNPLWPRIRPIVNWGMAFAAIAFSLWGGIELVKLLIALPISGAEGHHDWLGVCGALLASFGRTTAAVAIGAVWTLPAGILIGLSPRWSERLQPIIQVVASFPAPMLFPLVTMLLILLHIPFTVGCITLMLLGAQWYVLFNVIAGASAIPHDLQEVTHVYPMSRWQVWTKLYIPCVFPYLLTGLITAAGGAWNATIVAEYVQLPDGNHVAFGLGSLISVATADGNYPLLAAGVVTMAVFVVLLNRFFWKRLYRLAEDRYSLNM
jgi:NitT/TauT family transport system permease protein